jgi:transcriptional regulator with XRE-family HTH domain
MDLATFRKGLGLSQEECAIALGLKPTSKSWISDIENNERKASLKLALKIEKWSGGQVRAASICDFAAEVQEQGAAA